MMKDFVLNYNQKKILKNIGFLQKYGVYLAGGTALALQLGHRTSKDLDFYTKEHFEPRELHEKFRGAFCEENVSQAIIAKDTLKFEINITDISIFRYPYRLIRPLQEYQQVKLASSEDIAAMKIEALLTRGKKRDFVDIYFLIEKYGLENVLKFVQKKYPHAYNEFSCLTSLTYFEDAEKKDQGRSRLYLYSNISWKEIKKFLEKEVKKYQLSQVRE